MPELPEVETIARTLRPALVGMTITDADVRWARTVAIPTVRRFKEQIRGQVVRGVGRRAKFLRIELSDYELLGHLRMSGDLSLKRGIIRPARHDRLIFTLKPPRGRTLSTLAFNDTRKFGRVWLTANAEEITGRLGPEPLSEEFTPQWLSDALHRRHRQLKPLLLDQTFLAGLGNIYTDESLHRAGGPSSGGFQMPSHYGHRRLRMIAQSSPTGTQYLQAVGTAMGAVKDKTDEVVYVSSGEGATSEGEFHEALNWAARGRFPVIFLIQNNKYAISVPVEVNTAGGSVSKLVASFPGLYIQEVDGCDILASLDAMKKAVAYARARKGPALVHAHVIRPYSHSLSDDEVLRRLTSIVTAHTAAVLGHADASRVDAQRGFLDLGLDSLLAVELRRSIQKATGVPLPATVAFDHPSPSALAAMLRGALRAPGGRTNGRSRSELDGVEATLSALYANDELRPGLTNLLRTLLSSWAPATPAPDDSALASKLRTATDEELLALLRDEGTP